MARIERINKSRKEQKCSKCGEVIAVGMPYLKATPYRQRPIIRCTKCGLKSYETSGSEYVKEVGSIVEDWQESYGIRDGVAEEIAIPRKPQKKQIGEDVAQELGDVLEKIRGVVKDLQQLNLLDTSNVEYQRAAMLEKTLLELYLEYEKVSNEMKIARNALTFADLSKYMTSLSEKTNLFEDIKYVFVDEYQDTNKIQARIIKNIAKNSNFVAVGDVKQGIYGFRLASCETFLEDVENFENDENSAVNYLKENFRSSQKVLDSERASRCVGNVEKHLNSSSGVKSAPELFLEIY